MEGLAFSNANLQSFSTTPFACLAPSLAWLPAQESMQTQARMRVLVLPPTGKRRFNYSFLLDAETSTGIRPNPTMLLYMCITWVPQSMERTYGKVSHFLPLPSILTRTGNCRRC
ncbi:hypothetical protein AA313_de0202076 [Arthrobotrys entomopaga]|nr:hypothetical protein AA313_de0202076 [Arthrobotrys entomopaga]